MVNSKFISKQQKKNYLKYNKRCSFCNNKATTIDHLIPCHIFSITMDNEDVFRNAVRDRENWKPSCSNCNSKKSATFDIADIPSDLYLKYHESIDTYCETRSDVLKVQGGRCARCNKELKEAEGILYYFKDNASIELNSDNCCVCCRNCKPVRKKK